MTLGPSQEKESVMEKTEEPMETETTKRPVEDVDPTYFTFFFDLMEATPGHKAPIFNISDPELELSPLIELRRHLKHVGPERSELVLKDYFIASNETGFPANAYTQALSNDGGDQIAVMGKLYVDGSHNVHPDNVDEDGCIGYVSIPMGGVGVWWLDEPEIFVHYKCPPDTPGGDFYFILRTPHESYSARDVYHQNSDLMKRVRVTNCVFFDFVEMHPEASLDGEQERLKRERKERQEDSQAAMAEAEAVTEVIEDVKETETKRGEDEVAEDLEKLELEEEDYPSLDSMLRELGSSLDELVTDKELHYFMKYQLSQGTQTADGSEDGGLADLLRFPLIQELLYARGEEDEEEFFPRTGRKKARKTQRRTPKTVSGHSYGSNYVAMSEDLFLSPVVEASFAFHYPSLLGEKRFQELKEEDKVAQHRIVVTSHGKANLNGVEVGEGVETGSETHFQSLMLPFPDGHRVHLRPGLFVALKSRASHQEFQGDMYVVKCCYMVRRKSDVTDSVKIHGPLFRVRGFELMGKEGREDLEQRGILSGEQMDELVYMGTCIDAGVEEVMESVSVRVEPALEKGTTLPDWCAQGGLPLKERPDLEGHFLCRLKYEGNMRWVHLSEDEMEELGSAVGSRNAALCHPCSEKADRTERLLPWFKEDGSEARIGGETYKPGDFVLFDPTQDPQPAEKADTALKTYPEPYEENQKSLKHYKRDYKTWPEMSKYKRQPLPDAPEPLTVHRIEKLDPKSKRLDLRAFYRTSDIDHGSLVENRLLRLSREVYWSFEINSVTARKGWSAFGGRAWVGAFAEDKDADRWTNAGPNRLTCHQAVEFENGLPVFSELDEDRMSGLKDAAARAPDYPIPSLKALELFCGGGGMARGMKDVGIRTCYANDMCKPAIATFKRNFPGAVTHLLDINHLLRDVQDHLSCPAHPKQGSEGVENEECLLANAKDERGELKHSREKRRKIMETCCRVPRRGELDVICGGPPCQGFSKMNRFPKSGNSQRKNTGMTAMLASVDVLRPKFVVIENVANLAQHNSIIRAPLMDMGYQVQIYITNAMAYGVPESRRRNFIVCAAPGLALPKAPTPLYSSLYKPLHFPVMGEKEDSRGNGTYSALLYQMTSFEALSDLVTAPVDNQTTGKGSRHAGGRGDGEDDEDFQEGDKPIPLPPTRTTWWQRQMRTRQGLTTNNVTKKLTPQEIARVRQVPFPTSEIPLPNWRFIANKTVTVTLDGKDYTFEPLLPYYEDKQNVWHWRCENCIQREKEGKKLMGKDCNIQGDERRWGDKIIPSCLAHMAKKNSWTNCYGRVSYDTQFMTITCADGLTNKTGRLLHPELNRMYTARELARGQGFPDNHVFCGLHYRVLVTQVGNAVPPPMAREIGRSIADAVAASPALKADAPSLDDMPELI